MYNCVVRTLEIKINDLIVLNNEKNQNLDDSTPAC